MSDKQKAFGWITLLSALVLLPFLGETLFYSKGEPREAIVAFSMLESGNWILPLNYGSDIAYKPPFLYWCIAAVSSITGSVSEHSSRLPSALAFLAMQLVFFCFVARYRNTRAAIFTSLLLLTSFEVHRAAVACRIDMVQVACIVSSLCLLFRWNEQGCKHLPWAAIGLMGIATLTKGPVGSIFPCLCIGLYQLLKGHPFWKTFWTLFGIGMLSLIPYAFWFMAAWQYGGQTFVDLMVEENLGRFFHKMSYASHQNPAWYNVVTLIWGWAPWTLVLIFSLFGIQWKGRRWLPGEGNWKKRLSEAWHRFRNQEPVQLFTWVVILAIFGFYCIPESKRSVYLLPIYPFMALLIAQYLLDWVQKTTWLFRVSAGVFATLGGLLTIIFAAVRSGLVPASILGSGKHAAENIAFLEALEGTPYSIGKWLLILLPVIAAGCTYYLLRQKADNGPLLAATTGCILCLFVALDGVYQPTILAVKSDKHLAADINRIVPEGPVYSYTNRLIRFYCANYYLNDRMRNFMAEEPVEGYVVLSEEAQEEFLQIYGDTYQLEKIFHTDYRSCDLRKPIVMYRFARK